MSELNSQDRELVLNKFITKCIAITVSVIFLSMTTCSIHMNSYSEAEGKADAARAVGTIEIAKEKHIAEMARLKVVEDLIAKNIDPIAARCAVEGWTEQTSNVCLQLVTKAETTETTETCPGGGPKAADGSCG